MTLNSAAVFSHVNPPLEDDCFGLKMVMQEIDRQQNAHKVQENTSQKNTPQNSSASDQSESPVAACVGLPDISKKLPEVEVVDPDAVSTSSSVTADHHSIDSMRNPSSQTVMGVLGQSIQDVSRLSTGAILVGVDIAAPLLMRSLRGSAEAVAAHYPQQVQELTALVKQGQQRLQVLAEYVGGGRRAL